MVHPAGSTLRCGPAGRGIETCRFPCGCAVFHSSVKRLYDLASVESSPIVPIGPAPRLNKTGTQSIERWR